MNTLKKLFVFMHECAACTDEINSLPTNSVVICKTFTVMNEKCIIEH